MEPIRVEYVAPTKRAFERMKDILFRPFHLQKWFILGFSAWLSTLGEGGSSGNGIGNGTDSGSDSFSDGEETFGDFIEESTNWLEANLSLVLIIGGIILGIALVIGIVVLWVQSRGKFMFLDNVVHDRTLISEPWKEFRGIANSLFVWKLIFGFFVAVVSLLLVGGMLFLLWPTMNGEAFDMGTLPPLIIAGVLLLILSLVVIYITYLLENFVIPVMHRDRMPVNSAWKKFFSLHRKHPGSFVVFFLWTILIGIATGLAVFALILGTCCIAVIPLIIPYLGAVLLLPITVFLRLIGPEFLKQFGSDFDTLETVAKAPLPLN